MRPALFARALDQWEGQLPGSYRAGEKGVGLRRDAEQMKGATHKASQGNLPD